MTQLRSGKGPKLHDLLYNLRHATDIHVLTMSEGLLVRQKGTLTNTWALKRALWSLHVCAWGCVHVRLYEFVCVCACAPCTQAANPSYDNPLQRPYSNLLMSFLLVPRLMGAPHLPLITTEDDVLWVPRAHIRLQEVGLYTYAQTQREREKTCVVGASRAHGSPRDGL